MDEFIMPAEKELTEEEITYLKEHGAVELVRCKVCKWYDERTSFCDNSQLPREKMFFCADGIKELNKSGE